MDNQLPQIEIINDSPYPPTSPVVESPPWFRSRRFVIFVAAYLLCAIIGLIYNYSRPAVYRSSATLLTSAKTAIDQSSPDADIQHVAIQRQILLGQELLDETLTRLKITHPQYALSMADIRRMLQVKPVAETNLVEMEAEGSRPKVLPALINTWIDVYLDARAADIEKNKGDTEQILKNELHDQEVKIGAAREALNRFNGQHDIISSEREDNAATARLKGLNDALNEASDDEVKAKARLDAVNKAIARGEAVVPAQDQRSLADLEKRLQELREKLAEFDQRYTREYLALQPSLKYIPQEIQELEKKIAKTKTYGKNIVLTDARQDYDAAQQTVEKIRQQLAEHRQQAAEFNARFAQYETLKTDLEGLEQIYRETQERLVKVETQNVDKYPQVNVIERAYLPLEPVRPHYSRDTLIILTGSVLFGLFCVWAAEYLTRQQQEHQRQPGLTLSGIHLYKDIGFNNLQPPQTEQLRQQSNKALESPAVRELSDAELSALLAVADTRGRQLLGFLLSGLTLDEAAMLSPENFDLDVNAIRIPGASPRIIEIGDAFKSQLARSDFLPTWYGGQPVSVDDLAALIGLAAIDAGMPYPEEVDEAAIRHSYIVYLVRQGLRLAELPRLVGYLPPSAQLSYRDYSPPYPGRSLAEINKIHPVMMALPVESTA